MFTMFWEHYILELGCGPESCSRLDPETHKGLKRTVFNQTKQDRMRIFEEILFFKATYNAKTNNSLIFFQLDVWIFFFFSERWHSTVSDFFFLI